MKKHEKEVYDALYKYFDKILKESGHLDTVMELSEDNKGVPDTWYFTQENMSGAFLFEWADFEVYATPYWENAEGLAFAIYINGEMSWEGTIPLIVTGNSEKDFYAYLAIVEDKLINWYCV